MTLFTLTSAQIAAFLLIFARIGGCCITAPVLSSARVPPQIRAAFSVILATVLLPVVAPQGIAPGTSLPMYGALVAREVLVGVTLGYVANLIFTVVQMAGEAQDTQAGYGFVGVVDPTFSHQGAVLGQFQMVMLWVMFFIINGHHALISALAESFWAVPLTQGGMQDGLATHMAGQVTMLMLAAIRFGAPIIAAVLLTDLALGILQRSAPQLNLIAVGFQVKTSVAIIALILTLPFILGAERQLVPLMTRMVHETLAYLHG
jgi:flagellar biosynthetic protein FliR